MKSINNVLIIMIIIIIIFLTFSKQDVNKTITDNENIQRSFGIYKNDDNDGYNEFGLKTWYPTFDIMKTFTYIKCGNDSNIMDDTVSFAIIMNRIYQFKISRYPDSLAYLDVIMYKDVRQRYSTELNRLYLIDGYRACVNDIIPKFPITGNFEMRFNSLDKSYPNERKKHLTVSLIWNKSKSFILFSRLRLCCNRFWFYSAFQSEMNGKSEKSKILL